MDKEKLDFIHAEDTVDFVVRRSEFIEGLHSQDGIVIAQTIGGRYDICYAKQKDIPMVHKLLGTSFISSASILLGIQDTLYLEAAGITPVQYQPYLNLKGHGVILAFLDTGIDFTQDVFQHEDGTSKIISIYDQSIDCDTPPDGFFIGKEYTRADINAALRSENPAEVVPHKDTSGHGTFLASIAAGKQSDSFSGAAPDSEIIAVKLRTARPYYLDRYAVTTQNENVFESTAVMIGVEYVVKKAKELKRPVVICLGLGSNSGSHDGFSIFEEYLSGISNIRGVCVCTAAGNECQARHHMQGKVTQDQKSENIDIKVGEGAGHVYVNLWSPASDKLSISVRSPTGEVIGRVPARSGLSITEKLVLEPATVSIEYYFPVEGSSDQLTITRIRNATPGIWTITVYGDLVLNGVFDAWLPLSSFSVAETEFLSATPYSTVTVPATMIGAISCGAYDHLNNSLYYQSSWGPTRASVLAPEIIAPGVNIGGYYPTGYGAMSGTSTAAAITAGACALLMQWGIIQENDISLSTYQIKAYLIKGCSRNESMSYPNTQWGYGTLNLLQTFLRLRDV